MAKKELAILKTKEPLELVYSKSTKIKHLDDGNEIIKMLNYLYVLLNVKAENQLNEIEESVLNGFILDKYNNFTIEEIKHAFRLAVSGDLGIEMFQKLDSITFGKVLLNYKEFKNNKIRQHTMKKKKKEVKATKEDIKKIYNEFEQNCVLPYIEKHKKLKKPEISFEIQEIFNYYWKRNSVKLSEEEIEKFKAEGKELFVEDLKKQKFKGNKVDIQQMMGHRSTKLFTSCVALFYKLNDILEFEKVKKIGNSE